MKATYGRNGVPQLDDLDRLFRVLGPDPERAVVAPTDEQAPPLATPLHIDRVDNAPVAPEPAVDLARLEVEQEQRVVGAAGDQARVGRERDRRRGAFWQS